ncbi:hypothetical protein Droror1_Dr00022343 [Drosera rotundifolia]
MQTLFKPHRSHPSHTPLPSPPSRPFSLPPPRFLFPSLNAASIPLSISRFPNPSCRLGAFSVSDFGSPLPEREEEDLGLDGVVYQRTLRLVECAMFAAVGGLAFLLSSSLAIENYFGCFFALPIVLSSVRWGVAAGRKTMVATTVLLFVLSGPVKALTHLLMHGLVGLTMGSMWRLRISWGLSLFFCTLVRATGAVGYVLLSSFLISENILALITINVHAAVTFIFNSLGFNSVPSMSAIYVLFGTLVLFNCGCFVLLLHVLYAMFLARLGMKSSLSLPGWIDKAL